METPIVSVVLPVYNGENFVLEAIRSIQNQTFSNWELIILDDGSLDGSLKICQEQAASDPRIRVHANGINLGLAKTMNKLVRLATGQYIAVQEQDDISMPNRLRLEVDLLDVNPDVGLVSGVAAWIDDDGEIFYYYPGRLHQGRLFPKDMRAMGAYLFIEGCKVANPACMFRRAILQEIPGPFDEEALQSIDYQFFLHVAHRYEISGIPEILVNMRRGTQHTHYSKQRRVAFSENRRCINIIYGIYKKDKNSLINYWLYRKAMSRSLLLESGFCGYVKLITKLIGAIWYNPLNMKAWASIGKHSLRVGKKFLNYLPSSLSSTNMDHPKL
jgi:glycosyltransferase involved in cell wall biosynthesis